MRNRMSVLFFAILISIAMFNQVFCEISRISGEVDQVNLKFSTFVLLAEQWGGWEVFSIDSKTVISKAGKDIELADIKKGDFVIVTYNEEGDKKIAKTIIVQKKSKNR